MQPAPSNGGRRQAGGSGQDVLHLLHEAATYGRRPVVRGRRRREDRLGSLRGGVRDVAEGAVPVRRRAVRPATLDGVLALGGVVEGVRRLGDLVALGEVARRRVVLEAVLTQLLDRGEPLVLVHAVAGEV